jgi:hypothetical protein
MAETLISPGVLARENDSSFVSQQPVTVGAAIIGPTVKGPVEIPTVVTSYSEFVNKFGDVLSSGSDTYSYFTSIAAYNYFSNGGETLLVARVVSGSYTPATSTDISSNVQGAGGAFASTSFFFSSSYTASSTTGTSNGQINLRIPTVAGTFDDYFIVGTNFTQYSSFQQTLYFSSSFTSVSTYLTDLCDAIASSTVLSSIISGSFSGGNVLTITSAVSGANGNGFIARTGPTGSTVLFPNATNPYAFTTTLSGGVNGVSPVALVLETISEGIIMNSSSSVDSQGALELGTSNNIRWQVVNPNTSSGTFGLLIRQGNDITNNQTVLETWTNLSLDPNSPNYVSKVIGDYNYNYNPSTNQIEVSGSFPNASKYVRIKSVNLPTPNYFDNSGNPKSQYTGSIPVAANGAFEGATGNVKGGAKFYNEVTANNTQGLEGANYNNMIALLSNQDDYRFNALFTPGLFSELHTTQVNNIIINTQDRGDNIFVVDLVDYADTVTNVVGQAASLDTSYAAAYWPWVQIKDPGTGKNVWVPASTVIAGVYSYNDRVAEPWFAPAGINRGGLSRVIRAEQKLPQSSRDTLYSGKVNPIATFPGVGTVVYGQKTLQTRASALDRVNVRRLLIQLKSYISQIANNLVFEQNTIATRNQFLSQVNPYLESVQQKQGLYAFRVVMDDTNNTPDVIDRNQLVGQIYLQPTKTAEFIYLDFNVTPTGATFPV